MCEYIKGSMGDEMTAVAIGVLVVVILTIVFGCMLGTNTRGCRDAALRKSEHLCASAERLFGTVPRPRQAPPSVGTHDQYRSFGQTREEHDDGAHTQAHTQAHAPARAPTVMHNAEVAALLPNGGEKEVKHNYGRVMPPKANCKQARYSLRHEILPRRSDRGQLGVVNIASAADCRIEDNRRL